MSVPPPMRRTDPPGNLHVMPSPRDTATLQLEILLNADPVTGVVCAEGRQARAFVGWTDLFGQLETALDELSVRAPDTALPTENCGDIQPLAYRAPAVGGWSESKSRAAPPWPACPSLHGECTVVDISMEVQL